MIFMGFTVGRRKGENFWVECFTACWNYLIKQPGAIIFFLEPFTQGGFVALRLEKQPVKVMSRPFLRPLPQHFCSSGHRRYRPRRRREERR